MDDTVHVEGVKVDALGHGREVAWRVSKPDANVVRLGSSIGGEGPLAPGNELLT